MPTSSEHASGVFEVQMSPMPNDADGGFARFHIEKTWRGDLSGVGTGEMISAGDPAAGEAGYVAFERVVGELAGRTGELAFQQLGTISGGQQSLTYLVVPGSGTGELAGLAGVLELAIDADGTHRYDLDYDLPS